SPALPVRGALRGALRLSHMITRICFALLFVGFPLALGVKIRAQRRALGRSPVVLGRVGQNAVERWFERLSPLGLLFWPAVWLWIALGLAPLRAMPLRAVGLAFVATGAALSAGSVFLMGTRVAHRHRSRAAHGAGRPRAVSMDPPSDLQRLARDAGRARARRAASGGRRRGARHRRRGPLRGAARGAAYAPDV